MKNIIVLLILISSIGCGIPGPKGDPGDQGAQGIQGIQGNQGDTGVQGEKGDAGDKGEQGIQGDVGLQGAPGKDGTVFITLVRYYKTVSGLLLEKRVYLSQDGNSKFVSCSVLDARGQYSNVVYYSNSQAGFANSSCKVGADERGSASGGYWTFDGNTAVYRDGSYSKTYTLTTETFSL